MEFITWLIRLLTTEPTEYLIVLLGIITYLSYYWMLLWRKISHFVAFIAVFIVDFIKEVIFPQTELISVDNLGSLIAHLGGNYSTISFVIINCFKDIDPATFANFFTPELINALEKDDNFITILQAHSHYRGALITQAQRCISNGINDPMVLKALWFDQKEVVKGYVDTYFQIREIVVVKHQGLLEGRGNITITIEQLQDMNKKNPLYKQSFQGYMKSSIYNKKEVYDLVYHQHNKNSN